ncbi:hypothetical protein TVAG_463830 [Trichomonas vaginalis G3]|uniref:WD repeat protein n=1 Tax=Trichomonas vaginalis (strain ATCC PRA-98 / G3) TaxID=412133 RepID=A2E235_TRIV3|nr:protein modification by small protein conjugation or removal [Trichomonas vaginalis G3]EAY13249.1 hypothetical protein TVAG_463830 [Trichomonas vaginalis G3]KAI5494092.1 protein modification by small protein conjugation or removal [Trichomonas vaginalis G3]|eukprot:XP_001325472.1 hypothetical protein [Trichomonas vaginalis G3]
MDLSYIFRQTKWEGDCNAFPEFFNSDEYLIKSMRKSTKLVGHKGCINTCAFNPFGDKLITGCDDGCVWIWDIGTQKSKPLTMLHPHITNVFTTNFLSSNKFISGGNDATVQIVEFSQTSAFTTSFINHHVRKVLCSFVIDPNTFVTCSSDSTIRLFDTRVPYRSTEKVNLKILTEADMNYDGRDRLTMDLITHNIRSQGEGGGKNEIPSYSVDETLLLEISGRHSQIFSMDVNPVDRKQFLASAADGTVKLFDLRAIKEPHQTEYYGFSVREAYGSEQEVTGAAFDDTGKRIAATVIGGDIHVFETANSYKLEEFTPPPPRERRNYRGPRIDPTEFIDENGSLDIMALNRAMQATLHVEEEEYDEHEEEEEEIQQQNAPGCIQVLRGHKSYETIKSCNWFGDFVVTGSDDGNIYFYNVETGKIKKCLKGHEGNVNVVAVHRQKKMLATSGIDDYAMLWQPDAFTSINEEEIEREVQEALEDLRNNAGRSQFIQCNVM